MSKVSSQSDDQRTACIKLSRGFPLKWKENPLGLLVSSSRLTLPNPFCFGCKLTQKLPVAESSASIFLAVICASPFIQVCLVNQKACACWKCVTRLNSAQEIVLKALGDGRTSLLCCVNFAGLADSSVCQSRGRTAYRTGCRSTKSKACGFSHAVLLLELSSEIPSKPGCSAWPASMSCL